MNILRWLVLLCMIIPLAIPFGAAGDKPIDIVYSDLFLFFCVPMLFFYWLRCGINIKKYRAVVLIPVVAFSYYLSVCLIGFILNNGYFSWILSALRFIKPFFFVFPGIFYYIVFKPSSERFVSDVGVTVAVCVLVLFVSDVFWNPAFPNPRWGGGVLGLAVYGFPNSSSVYLVFVSCFLLMAAQLKKSLVLYLIYVLSGVIVVFSLSRAAALTYVIFLASYFFVDRKIKLPVLILIFVCSVLAVFYWDGISILLEVFFTKFERVAQGDDALSGRQDIWSIALSKIAERPLFGYGFEPFSNYNDFYDTPHQQYLEILFKSGFFGLALFFVLVVVLVAPMYRYGRYLPAKDKRLIRFLSCVIFALAVANMSQPNFSYSPAGNFFVFSFVILGLCMRDSYFAMTKQRSV